MPIRVRIDVNGRDERNYWIGRIAGGMQPDDENTYVIGLGTPDLEAWNMDGIVRFQDAIDNGLLGTFTHRYGDGLERCVERGLAAWNKEG